MQSKCLIEFCQHTTTKTSRLEEFNKLCRQHQVDCGESLMLHLPHSHASSRQLFLRTTKGRHWFSTWVYETADAYRSRFFIGHPFVLVDDEGNYRPTTADPAGIRLFEKTASIPTPEASNLAKPHPNPTSQVFKRKKS